MWLDRLKEMKLESKLTTKEIADKSGIPEPTLEKLFAGATKDPKLATIQQLVHFFGYTLDNLDEHSNSVDNFSRQEKEHIKKYRSLDPYGKEAVDNILDVEYRRCDAEKQTKDFLQKQRQGMETAEDISPEDVYSVPMYTIPLSAGTGQNASQEYPEDFHLKKHPPRGTSYIARVSGDSMEPDYQDGDLVFVHATVDIQIGQIGAFIMDGQMWIKELGDGELISHNSKYAPRPIMDDVRCQGLVIGICDKSYL